MKICHITSVHNTNDQRIFQKECVSLAEQNEYDVYLVGPGESKICQGVTIIGVGDRPQSRIERMLKFTPRIISAAKKLDADVYHLHDPELLRFALKLKNKGAKVIFDSHENILDSIDQKTYIPTVMRKVIKQYYKRLQNKILSKIDAIIVVSPQMMNTHKIYNDNVVLLPNYPRIDYQNINKNKPTRGRFIFAGGVSDQWSHREIIMAIENIDDIEYHIYGRGDNNYIEELKKLGGWGKVHYGGEVPFSHVQNEIAKSQFVFALCKPSNNTFGKQGTLGNTKLFEGMEKAKPIIATDFDLWKEIIEEENCGLCVDPTNVNEIHDAIIKIMEKPEDEINQMGENGRKLVVEKFSWEVASKNLTNIYKKIRG